MIAAVLVWYASSLKFQAEMGLLMALWLTVSAITSLLLIPAMIYVFRPAFVFGDGTAHAAPKEAAGLMALVAGDLRPPRFQLRGRHV